MQQLKEVKNGSCTLSCMVQDHFVTLAKHDSFVHGILLLTALQGHNMASVDASSIAIDSCEKTMSKMPLNHKHVMLQNTWDLN